MATAEEKAAKAAAKAGTEAVSVFDKHDRHVRTYSAELHGENFVALAEEFTKKNAAKSYTVRKAQ